MRILIYGAGVIGSLYGALLSAAGLDVTLYARGRRLETLRQSGLHYRTKDGVKRASINVIDTLAPTDRYDFVFLTVKEKLAEKLLGNEATDCRKIAEVKKYISGFIGTIVCQTSRRWCNEEVFKLI